MISLSLIAAMIAIESGGDDSAQGANGELGCLQIKPIVVRDVNRILGLEHDTRAYTLDNRLDRKKSIEMLNVYVEWYATKYDVRDGVRWVPDEDVCRIWNGGPHGPQKDDTLEYRDKVLECLASLTDERLHSQ